MSRTTTEGRVEKIADAALRAFSEAGFRRTQVSDVAKAAGVAQGTIYLYASGKEALFWMALQRALGRTPGGADERDVLDQIADGIGFAERIPSLMAAPQEPIAPLQQVLGELYDAIEAVAPAIRLVERCAQDWPKLAELFFARLRRDLLQRMADYLQDSADRGMTRLPPDFTLAARVILETIAWFAIHRAGDYDGRHCDNAAARGATLDALFHAYALPVTNP